MKSLPFTDEIMKRALYVFDLDGTILDTLTDLTNSVNFVLSKYGESPLSAREVADRTGNGVRVLVQKSLPADVDSETFKKAFADFSAHYMQHCADNTRAYDGIKDVLQKIREQGAKCAVVSNKTDGAVQLLAKKHFDGLFDFVTGQKDGVRPKPYPDAVELVLDALGVCKSDALYIGDSEVDVATAKNVGMDCLCVDWGFRDENRLKKSGAERIISDPQDILKF